MVPRTPRCFTLVGDDDNGGHLPRGELREGMVERQGCGRLKMSLSCVRHPDEGTDLGRRPVVSRKEHWAVSQVQVKETHHTIQQLNGVTVNS